MPGMTPLRPDDVHSARAWAAFVADDAAAAAPPSLEARVMRAAQAALAQKQRADAERTRRRWFAGVSAIAASLLAAAAWSFAPGGLTASHDMAPADASRVETTPESSAASALPDRHANRDEPPGVRADDQYRGRPRARRCRRHGSRHGRCSIRSTASARSGRPGVRAKIVRRGRSGARRGGEDPTAPIARFASAGDDAALSSPARSPARHRRHGRCGPSRSSTPKRSRPRRRHRCIASTTRRRRLPRGRIPPAPPK